MEHTTRKQKLVTVTLTLEEWFAFMARAVNYELSPQGAKVYKRAAEKLSAQVSAAS